MAKKILRAIALLLSASLMTALLCGCSSSYKEDGTVTINTGSGKVEVRIDNIVKEDQQGYFSVVVRGSEDYDVGLYDLDLDNNRVIYYPNIGMYLIDSSGKKVEPAEIRGFLCGNAVEESERIVSLEKDYAGGAMKFQFDHSDKYEYVYIYSLDNKNSGAKVPVDKLTFQREVDIDSLIYVPVTE